MKRHHFIIILAISLFLGALVTTLSTIQERDYQLRGYVDASVDHILPFRIPRLGVNADLTQYTDPQLRHNLELMEKAQITWVRMFVSWADVEPNRGHYNWAKVDRLLSYFHKHPKLEPVVVLNSTPPWARPSGTLPTYPPTQTRDYARFVSAFADRYQDVVDYYQIWDEPNLEAAWGMKPPRAVEYTALLAEAYEVIHAVDSTATVLAAALAPTVESGPKNISDIRYLRDMYASGAKDYMDAVAAKPYGFSSSPTDRDVLDTKLNFSRLIALREIMVANNDGQKALWASEWGWNALPDTWEGQPSIWGSVSADQQIQYTLQALARADLEWPWLGGQILTEWQPNTDIRNPRWGFALVNQDQQPTPLLSALNAYRHTNTARPGLYPAANPFAQYSGVWTFGSLGADIGWVQDSQFDLRFTGTDVSLFLRQDNYTAYLYPTIDNQPANALPRDADGNSYIVLSSASSLPEMQLVKVAGGLSQGDHTLHVVADRGWDRWAIGGFGVSSNQIASTFEQQIAVGWLTVLVSGWSVVAVSYPYLRLDSVMAFMAQHLNMTLQFILGIGSSIALLLGMMMTWGDGLGAIFRREPLPLVLALLTTGLIKLQPGVIVTVIAASMLLLIFYNHLYVGLVLTIFWAPFFLFPVQLYRFALPMAETLILLTTAAWALHCGTVLGRYRQSQNTLFPVSPLILLRKRLTTIDYLVCGWVILGFLSLLWAKRLPEAVTELRTVFIEPFLFYLIIRTSGFSRKQYLLIVDTMVIAGVVVAVIGLWQYLNGISVITAEGGAQRLASVYGSPNNVALLMGRCIPFALSFVLIKLDSQRRIFYGFALIPLLAALLLTQSVGGLFVGVPLSVAFVCLFVLRKRARLIIALLLVVLFAGFFVSLQSERFARMLDFSSGTNFYRVRVWQSALNMIAEHPFTGLGLDQFLYEFRGKFIMPDAWQEPNLSHPHNILLDFWVRLGLLGIVLLGWLQYHFWHRMKTLSNQVVKRDTIAFALLVGAMGSMINLVSHGMVDNSVFVIDLSYVFMLLLALTHLQENGRSIDEPLI